MRVRGVTGHRPAGFARIFSGDKAICAENTWKIRLHLSKYISWNRCMFGLVDYKSHGMLSGSILSPSRHRVRGVTSRGCGQMSGFLPGYSALPASITQMTCQICTGLREKRFPDDVCYVMRRFLRHMTQDTLHAPRKTASKHQNTLKRSKTAVGGPAATPQGS